MSDLGLVSNVRPPPRGGSTGNEGFVAGIACISFRREMHSGGEICFPFLSENARTLLGCDPQAPTLTAEGVLAALHTDDREDHAEAVRTSALSLLPCVENFRVTCPDGQLRWFHGTNTPMRRDDGTIIWEGAWLDVTPWKMSEILLQTVADRISDAIVITAEGCRVIWANEVAERIYTSPTGEIRGQCFFDLLGDTAYPTSGDESGEVCCKNKALTHLPLGLSEQAVPRPGGGVLPIEMIVSEVEVEGQECLVVVGRDISKRKSTELLLAETTRRLRYLTSELPGIAFQLTLTADNNFCCTYASEQVKTILGWTPDEIISDAQLLFSAIIEEDRNRLLKSLRSSISTMEPVSETICIKGGDGKFHWLSGVSKPRRRNQMIVWDGLAFDTTEAVEARQATERVLKESEERFRVAFSTASLGIVIAHLDGIIHNCNPAFEVMAGYSGDGSLIGKSFFQFVHSDLLPKVMEMEETTTFECHPHFADGRERHWRIAATEFDTLRDKNRTWLFFVEDVTEANLATERRRTMERALTEGQKLEALGRLAGGVAHELNNMLAPILMGSEMLMRTLDLDEKNKKRCQTIIEAAKHSRNIVRNVLSYCRQESNAIGSMDIVPVFREFCNLAESILPASIKVINTITIESATVMGDPGTFTQVLLNMANNARDAMEGSGQLTLTLTPVTFDQLQDGQKNTRQRSALRSWQDLEVASLNPYADLAPDKSYVAARVSDSGWGMPKETMKKIFDPFFTTKPVGQGTGLGLSVVQGIIKAMGGVITVDSAPGKGTTFLMVIPITAR